MQREAPEEYDITKLEERLAEGEIVGRKNVQGQEVRRNGRREREACC